MELVYLRENPSKKLNHSCIGIEYIQSSVWESYGNPHFSPITIFILTSTRPPGHPPLTEKTLHRTLPAPKATSSGEQWIYRHCGSIRRTRPFRLVVSLGLTDCVGSMLGGMKLFLGGRPVGFERWEIHGFWKVWKGKKIKECTSVYLIYTLGIRLRPPKLRMVENGTKKRTYAAFRRWLIGHPNHHSL